MSLRTLLTNVVTFSLPGSVPSTRVALNHRDTTKRQIQASGSCGVAAGNAACAAGLCCSQHGICGTGVAFCEAPGCQLSFGSACDGNNTPPGQDTSAVARPQLGSVPYGVDISHCTVNGKAALTFDDGPYIYTSRLLDILKQSNVRATFFVAGANGGKGKIEDSNTGYPAIIGRMYAEGHQIGSHTWSHSVRFVFGAASAHPDPPIRVSRMSRAALSSPRTGEPG